jgi:hypothetical protein
VTVKEIGTSDRCGADEIAWRDIWLSNVQVDAGRSFPVKIARPRVITRMSLSRRLDKLRRLQKPSNRRDPGWTDDNFQFGPRRQQEDNMDSTTLLIIILVILLLGGGGWYGRGRWY